MSCDLRRAVKSPGKMGQRPCEGNTGAVPRVGRSRDTGSTAPVPCYQEGKVGRDGW